MNNKRCVLNGIAVIGIGVLVSFVFSRFIHEWAFIPLALTYWGSILFVTRYKLTEIRDLFQVRQGSKAIKILTYVPCLFCIVSFVWGLSVISIDPLLCVLTIIFVIVNPIMEELMWRKYMMDHLTYKPVFKIIISTVLFTISHPLMWGIFSVTIRSTIMIVPLLVMGIIWGISYDKLKSIKHCIIAHGIVDLFNLSIWVFLNLFIPPVV